MLPKGTEKRENVVMCDHKVLEKQLRLRKKELQKELDNNDYSQIESVTISKETQINNIDELIFQLVYLP